MQTPKRFSWTFRDLNAAKKFSTEKRVDGSKDIVIREEYNREDKARGSSNSRLEGYTVIWTEYTFD